MSPQPYELFPQRSWKSEAPPCGLALSPATPSHSKMGQSHSRKPDPAPSPYELASLRPEGGTPPLKTRFPTSSPISSVSAPAPRRAITRLSELIDPDELIIEEARMNQPSPHIPEPSSRTRLMVESPSGQLLSAAEFRGRQDRKLTVAERKKAIQDETRRKIAMEMEAAAEARRGENQEGEKKKSALRTFLKKCGCGPSE